ncbi:MAG: hypothetical protein JSR33_02150 [Proteobacteria bacterium]|nr:hypothetical protein [Pseudomonadota bacterium]
MKKFLMNPFSVLSSTQFRLSRFSYIPNYLSWLMNTLNQHQGKLLFIVTNQLFNNALGAVVNNSFANPVQRSQLLLEGESTSSFISDFNGACGFSSSDEKEFNYTKISMDTICNITQAYGFNVTDEAIQCIKNFIDAHCSPSGNHSFYGLGDIGTGIFIMGVLIAMVLLKCCDTTPGAMVAPSTTRHDTGSPGTPASGSIHSGSSGGYRILTSPRSRTSVVSPGADSPSPTSSL